MAIIKNILKRFKDKAQAFRVAQQAGIAREFAEMKKSGRLKPSRSTKQPYQPGGIGLSTVSAAIKKDNGKILNRRDRKLLAKENGVALARYYNH